MSKATERGFVIGQQYVLSVNDADYSNWDKGTVVTFDSDDGTDVPRFRRVSDDKVCYVPLDALVSPTNGVVQFETEEVKVVHTVIRVARKLTKAEQDAITAIIN